MTPSGVSMHLSSMRDAANNATALARRMSYEQFASNVDAQAAVAMYLTIVGEAANKIAQISPTFFVDAHPAFPWEKMRALRNRIVHDYETLHLPTIWATGEESLPQLVAALGELPPPQIGS